MKLSYVYILANEYRTTFYIGMTANLKERMDQYKNELGSKFTLKYNVKDLIYFEEFTDINQAILREKKLKNWHHDWKINLIKEMNPTLKTLQFG